MIIKFKYIKKKISYTMKNNIIKIYSVPKEYSKDGLYIADYSNTSLEPYPSSESRDTFLLYHGIQRTFMGSSYMEVLVNKLGEIEYA